MRSPLSIPFTRKVRGFFYLTVAVFAAVANHAVAGERLNFDPDWRFTKSDPKGAEAPDFNDHDWSSVSTPHTFNDVDTFDDWSVAGHRGEQNQWSGRTWYRKTFVVPLSYQGKK